LEIDDAFVLRASQLVGLELGPEQLPGVAEQLRRTAAYAQLLDEFTLPVDEEIAPTWRP
jgi:hypothetical protein